MHPKGPKSSLLAHEQTWPSNKNRLGRFPMRLGDLVDDFTFVRADGRSFLLSAFAGNPLVLIFLRHLG